MSFPHKYIGSFTALNVPTPSVSVFYEDSIQLECRVTYPDNQLLMDAMPSITWTTDSMDVDLSNQTDTTNDDEFVSILYIRNANSSYCGVYTCAVDDSNVALESTETAVVDVGMWYV